MDYAPTSTMCYMQCPYLYHFRREWQPKQSIVAWTPNRLLGTAIAKGLEVYYKRLKYCSLGNTLSQVDIDDAFESALEVIRTHFVSDQGWTLEGLEKLTTAGLKAGIKTGFPLGGQILEVEEKLDSGIPDLVYRAEDSQIVVIDHKVVLKQSPDYVGDKLMSYDTSWQLAHYASKLSAKYGEFVGRTGIHLITLSPKVKAYTHFITWSADRLAMWTTDAKEIWSDMDHANKTGHYRRHYTHCQTYGVTPERRCEAFTACHELNGDETRYKVFYDHKEKV